MLSLLRKITPKFVLLAYHRILAGLASLWYGSPSDKMIVIGVTGTSGKSTSVYLISKMFEYAGYKVGAASTMQFKIDKREWINDKKMTMVGRFALQKLLADMAKANCQFAVIETTSQGIEQYRHKGINYDVVVFTNLYPEHIEAHGGFDNYKKAKLKLFTALKDQGTKIFAGQKVQKTIIANLDSEHAKDFLAPWAEQKFGFTTSNNSSDGARVLRAENSKSTGTGLEFEVDHTPFRLKLLGEHNVYNALTAIAVGVTQGLSLVAISRALAEVTSVPGRIEFVDCGQPFTVIVDYAFEPQAMAKLYDVVDQAQHQKIIHVLGGTGGGRDVARRPKIGKLAGERADSVIVTNEDPYDEDPLQIIEHVAAGVREAGKRDNENLFIIPDRREAIAKAVSLAQPHDVILITGKGSEQAIVVKGNKKITWDDRTVVREVLKNS